MNQFDKEGQEQFVIEYFKQVREELTTRVQIHPNLVLQKVTTCGAALGFLFSHKATFKSLVSYEIQLLGFAIIPIITMGYDVLIARNINALHRLGTFIRNELESLVTPSLNSMLWEIKYGQPKNSPPRNYGVAEIRFLSLFALATEITVTAIYWNQQPRYSFIPLILILFLLHFYVFSYMKQQILQFDTFEDEKS